MGDAMIVRYDCPICKAWIELVEGTFLGTPYCHGMGRHRPTDMDLTATRATGTPDDPAPAPGAADPFRPVNPPRVQVAPKPRGVVRVGSAPATGRARPKGVVLGRPKGAARS